MHTLNQAQTQLQQLLERLKEANTPRIASLTASEAQSIRMELLEKVQKIIAELYAVRNAQHLAEEGQVHVYRALSTMIRVETAVLNDAALDEIQAMLEDADAEVSQAQPPEKSSPRGS